MMAAWLTHWFRVSSITPPLSSKPSGLSSFPTLLIVPGMLMHLFITYVHALLLPYLSIMSPSVSLPSHLQHKCTTSHSWILCLPPLYAFFGRSAPRAEFSSAVCITKYYSVFVITVATHKYDQREEQNACTLLLALRRLNTVPL